MTQKSYKERFLDGWAQARLASHQDRFLDPVFLEGFLAGAAQGMPPMTGGTMRSSNEASAAWLTSRPLPPTPEDPSIYFEGLGWFVRYALDDLLEFGIDIAGMKHPPPDKVSWPTGSVVRLCLTMMTYSRNAETGCYEAHYHAAIE